MQQRPVVNIEEANGSFSRRALAQAAARAVGIYKQCELRLYEGSQLNHRLTGHLT